MAPRDELEADALLTEAFMSASHMVELRLDRYTGALDALRGRLGSSRKFASKPLILTFSVNEGSPPELLKKAGEAVSCLVDYADYVDISGAGSAWLADVTGSGCRVIASKHLRRSVDYPTAMGYMEELESLGCDLVKFVFEAQTVDDNLTALRLSQDYGFPHVVFCMGDRGLLSRVLCTVYGSSWTYASVKRGLETAPGQLDVESMTRIYSKLSPGS